MGLIKAALGAAGGVMADQWKEYFYCDALEDDVLVMKGQKRTSKRSSNRSGSENIITDGSGIAVADGQCMIIVENGKVKEVCAEPGEYTLITARSRLYSAAASVKGSGIHLQRSASALPTAVRRQAISGFTILTQKKSWEINTARRRRFRSA